MPKIGKIVIYRCAQDETKFNNSEAHPAIVTCRHGDGMVNLKVFFNGGPCEDRISVLHRPEAQKHNQAHFAHWDFD